MVVRYLLNIYYLDEKNKGFSYYEDNKYKKLVTQNSEERDIKEILGKYEFNKAFSNEYMSKIRPIGFNNNKQTGKLRIEFVDITILNII